METWRYAVLFTVIFLVTAVPAIIGLYWLLYIYPYDKNKAREETNIEETRVDETNVDEPEWTNNPIHIESSAL